jgi:hypothetical protein
MAALPVPSRHGDERFRRWFAKLQHTAPAPSRPVELPGDDLSLVWETPELTVDVIEEFLAGVHRLPEPSRQLSLI